MGLNWVPSIVYLLQLFPSWGLSCVYVCQYLQTVLGFCPLPTKMSNILFSTTADEQKIAEKMNQDFPLLFLLYKGPELKVFWSILIHFPSLGDPTWPFLGRAAVLTLCEFFCISSKSAVAAVHLMRVWPLRSSSALPNFSLSWVLLFACEN